MLYLILALAGLLVIVALFTFLRRKQDVPNEDIVAPEEGCCGAHAVCEKGLKKIDTKIEYFEDEELDALKGIASDVYSDEQLEMFRDVLYTLRPEEIEDWFISLDKRGISFPDALKPEALDLMKTQ